MAAKTHATLTASNYTGTAAQGTFHNTNDYGAYNSGFGSLASHPYQYEGNNYASLHNDNQQQQLNPHSNNQTPRMPDRTTGINNNNLDNYVSPRSLPQPYSNNANEQHTDSNNHQQKPYGATSKQRHSDPVTNPHQANLVREHQITNRPLKHQINKAHSLPKSSTKPTAKANKSSTMRAAAIKKQGAALEQKRRDQYFPSTGKGPKSREVTPETDGEYENDDQKKSVSHHRSRRTGYNTDGHNNSGDEDNRKRSRSKSQKRATFSDTVHDKHHHHLPPIRHGQVPPYYDPYLDPTLLHGHPLKRHPYYDEYLNHGPYMGPYALRHTYGETENIPPYLAPYHNPYDPFFDYEKRKMKQKRSKERGDHHTDHEDNGGGAGAGGYETERTDGAKSQLSRKGRKSRQGNDSRFHSHLPPGYYPPGIYDDRYMLEVWRQERNDYLKSKFRPTVHDVLYAQQWMKSDSYLENQRRRALRDTQGYFFPYKKYTLKDYKEIQKLNMQNPYSEVNEATLDRRERARKRQEYGLSIERQTVDNPGTRQVLPHDMAQRKQWHAGPGDLSEAEKASKRDRALEYARDQVRYYPSNSRLNYSHGNDHSINDENNSQYGNNHYQPTGHQDDNHHRSNYERSNNDHQSYDDYE